MSRSTIVIGIGSVAEALARHIAATPGWELAMLISSAGGTARMARIAEEIGTRYRATQDVNQRALVEEVQDISPLFIFSADNQQKLCSALLSAARVGAVNFHNGPLPAYRGLNIPSWVIWNEESSHAISWHWMLDKLDAGATILSPAVELGPAETAFSLTLKCVQAAADSVPELLRLLETAVPNRDDHSEGGRYYRRADLPNEGIVDDSWTAQKILRLYRALSYGRLPVNVPPIRLHRNGRYVAVKSITLVSEEAAHIPGSHQELLRCPDGMLLITLGESTGS